MAQQVLDLSNQIAAQRQAGNDQQKNPPQQPQQAPPQVQFAKQPQFIEDQGEYYDYDHQGVENFNRTYILESGSSPSHINRPFTKTQQLPSPTVVFTPDDIFTVRSRTTIPLPLKCGVVRAGAFVHPALTANFISPIPVACQVGLVLLTESQAAVQPKHQPSTEKAIAISQPIATVKNGVYHLDIPRKQKHKALGSRSNNQTP